MALEAAATRTEPTKSIDHRTEPQGQDAAIAGRVTADFDRNRQTAAGDPIVVPQGLQNGRTDQLVGAVNRTDGGDGFNTVNTAAVTLAAWNPTPLGPDQSFDRELVRQHPSFEAARNQALAEVGDLGPNPKPVYGKLGDTAGAFVGLQSADGKKGFRLDYASADPNNPDAPSGPHFNWWDRTQGTKRGDGARQGAEYFPGSKEEFDKRLQEYQRFDPATRQQTEQQRQQEEADRNSFMKKMEAITGLTGAALITYLIFSEGSRLFPPRNLIPVP